MIKPYYETKLGKLYCCDSLELLPQLDVEVDLVLTDPPYLMHMGGAGCFKNRKYKTEIHNNLDSGFDLTVLKNFDNWFCFCSKSLIVDLINIASDDNWMILTWNKNNPLPQTNNTYLPDTEYIIHKYKKNRLFGNYEDKRRFIITDVEKNNIDHPTVKPIKIIKKLLRLGSQENDLILDPFLGSGTTAVAAESLNRRWIGIEKEQKYCDIAIQRLQNEVQYELFGA